MGGDPAPRDVDSNPRTISLAGFPYSVAIVPLAMAAHTEQIAVVKQHANSFPSPVAFEIEDPRSSQAE